MEKRDSVKFFLRFLLLTIITFILVTVSLVLSFGGGVGLIIGAIIVVINAFFLLSYFVMGTTKLIKHIFSKKKDYFDFMYVVNFLFVTLITGVFLFFYFVLMAATLVILLPILA